MIYNRGKLPFLPQSYNDILIFANYLCKKL